MVLSMNLPVPPGPLPEAPRCPHCPSSGGSLPQLEDASATLAGSLRRPLRSRLLVLRLKSSSDAVEETAAARFTYAADKESRDDEKYRCKVIIIIIIIIIITIPYSFVIMVDLLQFL